MTAVLKYADLKSIFVFEDTLPDGLAELANSDRWQEFVDALVEAPWQVDLSDDNAEHPLTGLEQLKRVALASESVVLKVWLSPSQLINVFVYHVDGALQNSIDFDFATKEIVDQESTANLAAFVKLVGDAVGAPVAVTHEGVNGSPIFSYQSGVGFEMSQS